MNQNADERLLRAFEAHDLACIWSGEFFKVDNGNLWIRSDVYVKAESPAFARVVLEITAVSHLLGNRPVLEAFAGRGATVEAATNEAFGKFLLGSFHVLIEALTSHVCEAAQAEIEHWGIGDAGWRVYSGPLLTHYSSDSMLAPDYGAFLSQLQTLYESEASPGPHWIRVFLGVLEGKVIGGEVLLDNEIWEPAQSKLFGFPWKCAQEYQSIRHFMLAFANEPAPVAPEKEPAIEQRSRKSWWRFWWGKPK